MEQHREWCIGYPGPCKQQVKKGRLFCHKCWPNVPDDIRGLPNWQVAAKIQELELDEIRKELRRKCT